MHAIAGTAAVEVDLVVAAVERPARAAAASSAGSLPPSCSASGRSASGNRSRRARIATHDRRRRDHLGVEQHARREAAQEVATVPVGPIHHRSDRHSPIEVFPGKTVTHAQFYRLLRPRCFCEIVGHFGEFSVCRGDIAKSTVPPGVPRAPQDREAQRAHTHRYDDHRPRCDAPWPHIDITCSRHICRLRVI